SNSDNNNKGIDFDNYTFENEKSKNKNDNSRDNAFAKKDTIPAKRKGSNLFSFPQTKSYFPSFHTDYEVTQIDNSFLVLNYQLFSVGASPVYLNPRLNILSKTSLSDLFEDQRITFAYRFNFSGDYELY